MKGMCMKDFLLKQLLAGNKTMTRRTGGLEKVNEQPDKFNYVPRLNSSFSFCFLTKGLCPQMLFQTPRYVKGSTVYIKEGYKPAYFNNGCTAYATDWNPTAAELMPKPKFKNKLFMPAHEARYFVRIEDVYPQRLQDITEEDAVREGVERIEDFKDCYKFYSPLKHYTLKQMDAGVPLCYNAKKSFATLIDSINGKGTWNKNPWVWVYVLKLV